MRRLPLLITIFTVAVLVVAAVVIGVLYRTSLTRQAALLTEIVDNQARTIEGIASHEQEYAGHESLPPGHGDPLAATLAQLRYANTRFSGFGRTGEFALARREGDSIVYLLNQRSTGPGRAAVLPFNGSTGEPMRRALSGRTGTVIGPDYSGVKVLAAYAPVNAFGLGVVAKMNMAEVRAPFVRAGLIGILAALAAVLLGSLLFYRITHPVLAQLQANETRMSETQKLAHLGSWTLNLEKNELEWSDEVYRIFGLEPHEFKATYEAFLDGVHPDDRAAVDAAYTGSVRENRDGYEIEHRIVRKRTGEVRFVEERCRHIRDAAGRVVRSTGMIHDITDRRRAEDSLRESAARLATILEATKESIWLFAPDGQILAANQTAAARLGMVPAEVVGRRFQDVLPDELSRSRSGHLGKVVESGRPIEFEDERAGMVFRHSFYPVLSAEGRVAAVASFSRDITESRRAEQALRQSEERYRVVAENTYDFEFWLDANRRYVYASPSCERVTGYRPEEFLADPELRFRIVHPDDRELLHDHDRTVEHEQSGSLDHRIIRRDGSVRWIAHVCQPIFDANGKFLGTRGSNRDITERKLTEEALRRSRERQAILANTAAALLATNQPQGVVEGLCRRVMEHLDCQIFVNFLVDEPSHRLRLNACAGVPPKKVKLIEWLDFGQAVCGAVAESGRPITVERIQTVPDPRAALVKSLGADAYCCHPLLARGKVIGTLSFGTTTRPAFSDDDRAMMKAVSDLVAVAMERVRSERVLRESEERLRKLYAAMSEGLALHRMVYDDSGRAVDYRIVDVNPAFEAIIGISRDQAVGQLASKLYGTGSPPYLDTYAKVAETGVPADFETEFVPMAKCFHISAFSPGKGVFATVFSDITARKQSERRIAEQATMLASANDAIIGYDPGYHVTFWNRAAELVYGYTEAEALGRISTELFHPVYVGGVTREQMVELLAAHGHVETESVRTARDGRKLSVEAHVIALRDEQGKTGGYVSVDRDVTERKRVEEALARQNAVLHGVSQILEGAIVNATDEDLAAACLAVAERITGSEMGFIGELGPDGRFRDLAVSDCAMSDKSGHRSPAQDPNLRNMYDRVLREGRSIVVNEPTERTDRVGLPQGHPPVLAFLGVPLVRAGRLAGMVGLANRAGGFRPEDQEAAEALAPAIIEALDSRRAAAALAEAKESLEVRVRERTAELITEIEERRAAEKQLAAASQYARSLIESSLDPLVTINADGKVTDVNEATIKATGASRGELIGTDFSDYFTEPEKARDGYRRVFAEGFVTDYPLTIRHRDGHLTDVLYNASVYLDADGAVSGVFAAARDVTERKRAERQLAAASQYARSLIESSLDPLVTISADGKITDVNEATIKATGASRVELIGSDFSEFFTEPQKAREGYQRVFAEGFVTDYPLTIRHRDGHLTDVLYNASVYKDTRGNIVGVFAAARDVTERKRAEAAVAEERQRFQDVLNMLPAYVVLLAPDYTVPFANRFFEERFGKSHGRRCFEYLFQRTEACENCETYQVMKTGGPHHWEWLGPDGRNYDIYDFPFHDVDGSPLILEVGLDITERKQAEDALQKAHDQLETKVAERTAELSRSNAELEQFAYVASHDLQEPLRMVASYVELLGRRYKGRLDEKADKYIAYASGGAIRMHQLVNDLLAFSRVGTRAVPLAPTSLDQVVAQARENLTVAIEKSGAVVEVSRLPTVLGDETQLVQLFQNLFDNAIKFCGATPPVVSVSCRDGGNEWECAVRDNGIGIDPKHRDRIFRLFQRLHTQEEYSGTGIGLAVCKKIVERHGGTIRVEPAEGGGSVFRFTLPKQPADAPATPGPAANKEEPCPPSTT